MLALALFVTVFLFSFGQLLITQVAQLVREIPSLAGTGIAAVNDRRGTNYAASDILTSLNLTPAKASGYASAILGGVLSLFGSVASAAFSVFTTPFSRVLPLGRRSAAAQLGRAALPADRAADLHRNLGS